MDQGKEHDLALVENEKIGEAKEEQGVKVRLGSAVTTHTSTTAEPQQENPQNQNPGEDRAATASASPAAASSSSSSSSVAVPPFGGSSLHLLSGTSLLPAPTDLPSAVPFGASDALLTPPSTITPGFSTDSTTDNASANTKRVRPTRRGGVSRKQNSANNNGKPSVRLETPPIVTIRIGGGVNNAHFPSPTVLPLVLPIKLAGAKKQTFITCGDSSPKQQGNLMETNRMVTTGGEIGADSLAKSLGTTSSSFSKIGGEQSSKQHETNLKGPVGSTNNPLAALDPAQLLLLNANKNDDNKSQRFKDGLDDNPLNSNTASSHVHSLPLSSVSGGASNIAGPAFVTAANNRNRLHQTTNKVKEDGTPRSIYSVCTTTATATTTNGANTTDLHTASGLMNPLVASKASSLCDSLKDLMLLARFAAVPPPPAAASTSTPNGSRPTSTAKEEYLSNRDTIERVLVNKLGDNSGFLGDAQIKTLCEVLFGPSSSSSSSSPSPPRTTAAKPQPSSLPTNPPPHEVVEEIAIMSTARRDSVFTCTGVGNSMLSTPAFLSSLSPATVSLLPSARDTTIINCNNNNNNSSRVITNNNHNTNAASNYNYNNNNYSSNNTNHNNSLSPTCFSFLDKEAGDFGRDSLHPNLFVMPTGSSNNNNNHGGVNNNNIINNYTFPSPPNSASADFYQQQQQQQQYTTASTGIFGGGGGGGGGQVNLLPFSSSLSGAEVGVGVGGPMHDGIMYNNSFTADETLFKMLSEFAIVGGGGVGSSGGSGEHKADPSAKREKEQEQRGNAETQENDMYSENFTEQQHQHQQEQLRLPSLVSIIDRSTGINAAATAPNNNSSLASTSDIRQQQQQQQQERQLLSTTMIDDGGKNENNSHEDKKDDEKNSSKKEKKKKKKKKKKEASDDGEVCEADNNEGNEEARNAHAEFAYAGAGAFATFLNSQQQQYPYLSGNPLLTFQQQQQLMHAYQPYLQHQQQQLPQPSGVFMGSIENLLGDAAAQQQAGVHHQYHHLFAALQAAGSASNGSNHPLAGGGVRGGYFPFYHHSSPADANGPIQLPWYSSAANGAGHAPPPPLASPHHQQPNQPSYLMPTPTMAPSPSLGYGGGPLFPAVGGGIAMPTYTNNNNTMAAAHAQALMYGWDPKTTTAATMTFATSDNSATATAAAVGTAVSQPIVVPTS